MDKVFQKTLQSNIKDISDKNFLAKVFKAIFQTINMVIGNVIQFRRGRKTYTPRHFLIEIPTVNSKEKAIEYVGKKVEWKSTGKKPKIIIGKISSVHGGNGVVRAIFEKGLPGQAIGTDVSIN